MRVRSTLTAIALSCMLSGVARADDFGTLVVTLNSPGGTDFYRLRGQSAFIETVTTGVTSGGQLDNITTPGNIIGFPQVFPQANTTDYLTFAYFGLIERVDPGTNLLDESDDMVIDTSAIVALRSGNGVGVTLDSLFGGSQPTDEASVVTALSTSFDGPVYQNLFDQVQGASIANGVISVPQEPRIGDTLRLIAFIGGNDGDLGVDVGSLTDSLERVVPEPASLSAIAGASLLAVRRRRA